MFALLIQSVTALLLLRYELHLIDLSKEWMIK
jgi:hypothetical protein